MFSFDPIDSIVMVLCMRESMSLFFKQIVERKSKSELQTVGLFAMLVVLTVMFVLLVKAVQFSPMSTPSVEIKNSTEAKISP